MASGTVPFQDGEPLWVELRASALESGVATRMERERGNVDRQGTFAYRRRRAVDDESGFDAPFPFARRRTRRIQSPPPHCGVARHEASLAILKELDEVRRFSISMPPEKSPFFPPRTSNPVEASDTIEPQSQASTTGTLTVPAAPSGSSLWTRRTVSTRPTTHSGPDKTGDSQSIDISTQKALPARQLQSTAEKEIRHTSRPSSVELEHGIPGRSSDDISVISDISTVYTSHQRDDVIARFSRAVSERISRDYDGMTLRGSSDACLQANLRRLVKSFVQDVISQSGLEKTDKKALKMVRHLRAEISKRILGSVLGVYGVDLKNLLETLGATKEGRAMGHSEKVMLWGNDAPGASNCEGSLNLAEAQYSTMQLSRIQLGDDAPISTCVDSESVDASTDQDSFGQQETGSEPQEAAIYDPGINPADILRRITSQPAFRSLIEDIEDSLDRFSSEKLDIIRRRVSPALDRIRQGHRTPASRGNLRARFHVDWDLEGFFEVNYDSSSGAKEMARVISVTGTAGEGWLCPVGEYITRFWPESVGSQLLDALQYIVSGGAKANLKALSREHQWQCCDTAVAEDDGNFVLTDWTAKTIFVSGSKEFIVSVAQQLCWLAVVFRPRGDKLKMGHVAISETSYPTSSDFSFPDDYPQFRVSVQTEKATSQDPSSCWTSLAGTCVIAHGFPVPARDDERGIEVRAPIMAALAGTPQAVLYDDGFVFKGRYHALVPIGESASSIQWHMLDTYPKRLSWSHIDQACPTRVRDGDSFDLTRRSFLGWCPKILEFLGTAGYNYRGVQWSSAGKAPKSIQVEKANVGFSHIGQLTLEVSIGKNDGYYATRAGNDYETLLDDAREIPVVLHDTVAGRAYQSNGEDFILQVLHHRRVEPQAECYAASGIPPPKPSEELRYALPDRSDTSTRLIMLENGQKFYRWCYPVSGPRTESSFRDEVKLLYSTLEALQANVYEARRGSLSFSMSPGQSVRGWEYLHVVKNSRNMALKNLKLKRTCGNWNEYAKDIRAIVIVGKHFGDLLVSASPEARCSLPSSLPRDQCFLAVPLDTISELFDRQGCKDTQTRLTDSGLILNRPESVFSTCREGDTTECRCDFLQTLVEVVDRPARFFKRSNNLLPVGGHGAIVIGSSSRFWPSSKSPSLQKTASHASPSTTSQPAERPEASRAPAAVVQPSQSSANDLGNSIPLRTVNRWSARRQPPSLISTTSDAGSSAMVSSVTSMAPSSQTGSQTQASSATSISAESQGAAAKGSLEFA